jgi:hypothetical protein
MDPAGGGEKVRSETRLIMLSILTDRVRIEVSRVFSETDAESVLSLFEATDFYCNFLEEIERVRLAMVYGSGGNMDKFKDYIALSKVDYRDVLMSSGLGNSDWKTILLNAGYYSESDKEV